MSELKQHLSYVKHICQIMGFTPNTLPLKNYDYIHINSNQRNNSNVTYPPILISTDFKKIQTNVGFLDTERNFDTENKDKIIQILNLKQYNNNYYFVDTEQSHKGLEHFYTKTEIENGW